MILNVDTWIIEILLYQNLKVALIMIYLLLEKHLAGNPCGKTKRMKMYI